jgi:hypothetical protein
MTKEDLLKKIEKQVGYIDAVDAFRLISLYTDEFGILKTKLSIEDELIYMYMKLRGYNNGKANDIESSKLKICTRCKIEKRHILFKSYYYKDEKKRKSTCMDCDAKYKDFSDNWHKSIEEKIKKMK